MKDDSILFLEDIMKKTGMRYTIDNLVIKTTHSLANLTYYSTFSLVTNAEQHKNDFKINKEIITNEKMAKEIKEGIKRQKLFKRVKNIFCFKEKGKNGINILLFILFKNVTFLFQFEEKSEHKAENFLDFSMFLNDKYEKIFYLDLSIETKKFINFVFKIFKENILLSEEIRLKNLFKKVDLGEYDIFEAEMKTGIIDNIIMKIKEKQYI